MRPPGHQGSVLESTRLNLDWGDGAGLRGRLVHPFANGRKAAPLLTFILDDRTLGEGADHGVDIREFCVRRNTWPVVPVIL